MSDFADILFWSFVVLATSQGLLVVGYLVVLWNWKRELISDEQAPKAAVILALRGGDPFLEDSLRQLLSQDYPNYEIKLILDHPKDPAIETVNLVLSELTPTNVEVVFLENPRSTCSLKCSSLIQVVGSLDDSYHFVAQLDADTIPHTTWLRELATGLQDPAVGAVTGNRWYMPKNASLGSLIRYTWNVAAIVQMYWYHIAWGGTLAIKMKVYRETDLLEKIGHAYCEDTMLYSVLHKAGLKVKFVPSLLMVNRESCDTPGFYRWVQRQLLSARLYHPHWIKVLLHGVLSALIPLLSLGLITAAFLSENWELFSYALKTFMVYEASIFLMIPLMELVVRRLVAGRGEPTAWLSFFGFFTKGLAAFFVTQVVYTAALLTGCQLRDVNWRGVVYSIAGPWEVHLQKYIPYQEEECSEENSSL